MASITLEQAIHRILGDHVATEITMRQGLHWAYAAAVAKAKTTDDPEALAAINTEIRRQKKLDAALNERKP